MSERTTGPYRPSRSRRALSRIGVLLASVVLTGRAFAGETPTTLRKRSRKQLFIELSLFGVAVLAALYVHYGLPAGVKSFLATAIAIIGGFTMVPFAFQYVVAKCWKQIEYPGSELYALRQWITTLRGDRE